MGKLYFETKTRILDSYDIQKIAEAMTGYQLKDTDEAIRTFANTCPGIIREIKNPTVEDFLNKKETVKAIVLYRDIHGCTIVEARNAVNAMMDKMVDEGKWN